MRTGAAYIRVSTEEQLEFSPDSQLKKLLEYAGQHDISLPEAFIFSDEGISGRSAEKRPGFLRMIAAARLRSPRPSTLILRVEVFPLRPEARQDSIFL
jgi:DNA invertase Pin-like site-specific DNA recombinase